MLTLIGLASAPPDPQQNDSVAHAYFLAGQWMGPAVFCTVLFVVVAALRNVVARKLSS
jgi:hypothetical protein